MRKNDAAESTKLAKLQKLTERVIDCTRCPRLVHWRKEVAERRPRSYLGQTYWSRPITGFGDPQSKLMIVGLAPAAHGGNRTGRIFTGDRSASFLFQALWKLGLSSKPDSIAPDDGVELFGCYLTAVVRCAPPANKPTRDEIANCREYLAEELSILRPKAIVALGQIAWIGVLDTLQNLGFSGCRPRPKFSHGSRAFLSGPLSEGTLTLFGSYHPSQQNTFTGKLDQDMLVSILKEAAAEAGIGSRKAPGNGSIR